MSFGLEVRRLRLQKGYDQGSVAEAMGLDRGSVSAGWRLEWGLRFTVPGPRAMAGLARHLGVSEAHLLKSGGYGIRCGCGECAAVALGLAERREGGDDDE